MEHGEKKKYIGELKQILQEQGKILDKLNVAEDKVWSK